MNHHQPSIDLTADDDDEHCSAAKKQRTGDHLHYHQQPPAPTSAFRPPSSNQIIDLTNSSSPSPPPSHTSFADLPPTTPVCIGQLTVTALVLYPIQYLCFQPGLAPGNPLADEWAHARLRYDAEAKSKSKTGDETIHIHVPQLRLPNGNIVGGETFGVVEQKVANTLGPMLGRALIRIDARVRRAGPNAAILPLEMLVFTPKGNIGIVANFLSQAGLYLDHPSPSNAARLVNILYSNPHNPPPGGFRAALAAKQGLSSQSRWSQANAVPGKSVEIQRSQVDELFKSLKGGDELLETDPSPEIATCLYPHQKKALTFLLEREREITLPNGKSSSLWISRKDAYGRQTWYNAVTQREVNEVPKECKGALLADDMGLGKTIACVALLASTLQSAREFAATPLTPPQPPPSLASDPSLTAGHFAGSVWGMPDTADSPFSAIPTHPNGSAAKESAKERAQHKRLTEEYQRACRLKARSRATLIVCPLSTVSNWEDQFREHWKGEVTVVGGGGGPTLSSSASCPLLAGAQTLLSFSQPGTPMATSSLPSMSSSIEAINNELREVGLNGEGFPPGAGLPNGLPSGLPTIKQSMSPPLAFAKPQPSATPSRPRDGTPLRIYIYHGNARRPEPSFLADFDVVITTYATLASEFSKQSKSIESAASTPGVMEHRNGELDEDASSDGGLIQELDEYGRPIASNGATPAKPKPKKRKTLPLSGSNSEASSPLQMVHWFRVVLDEAHSIKETTTVGCRASCDLAADRRICLTGTPVQNKLDDVYALIKFLRLEPFDEKAIWTEFIGGPVKFGQHLGVARLQMIMKCITLRRTKESRTKEGVPILTLPPRRDELRYLKFDEQEQSIYNGFFDESKAEFNQLSKTNSVMKNYVGILQKILRLRQICDHWQLVEGKTGCVPQMGADSAMDFEEVMAAIQRDGLNFCRASAVFTLLRESGTAQCTECGYELATPLDNLDRDAVEMDPQCIPSSATKRGRKPKASASAPGSRGPTRPSSPSGSCAAPSPRPILTRCQHLFCFGCFRNCVCPNWPDVPADFIATCSECQMQFSASADAIEVSPDGSLPALAMKKKGTKKERRQKGVGLENFQPSTKIRALLGDLIQFSKANPYSTNYDPSSLDVQMVDEKGNNMADGITKTVVFSQWTSMLDKVEEALEVANIQYDRLDGTMKRDERTRAMDNLKHNPACEVLLVSLKAGGVGLNLTAAQRVYLMDPYWNPAVENQAVDRIHRLGQTRPVTTVKLIIENSIEARLLAVQKKKTALANVTLDRQYTKAELLQRRIEDLAELFG